VSVGADAAGAPVATFSRCVETPADYEGQPDTGAGSGCRIHMLDLANDRESRLPIPAPHGVSDITPSMWHGSVAFARKSPAHREIEQVMLWTPQHPRTLTTLPHGAVPSRKFVSLLVGLRYSAANPVSGRLSGSVLAIAGNGSATYALTAPEWGASSAPACSSEHPCALAAIALPALTKREPEPVPPFEEFFAS
jgi:hypothetical protein